MQTLWDWRRQISDLYARVRAARDPQAAWADWRATRDRLFGLHPDTPLDAPASFTGLPYFAYDPGLRFAVTLAGMNGPPLSLPAGGDGMLQLQPFARTVGLAAALGKELTLYWLAGYGGGVFLPFADATSGKQSFGAGRYLLDTIKSADLGADAEGRTILDFNFAYNPSCAYSARWVCPLAPAENRVSIGVAGGEMTLA